MSTSFPVNIEPWRKFVAIGREVTAGTPVTTGLYLDECRTIDFNTQQTTEKESGYLGAAATDFDESMTQEISQGSFTLPFRNGGVAAALLLSYLGSGSEVVSGAGDPYSHTGTTVSNSTRCDSWTVYEARGDNANVKQMPFGTINSLNLASNPSGAVTLTASMMAKSPAFVNKSALTIGQYVGSTANYLKTRQMGNSWTLTLYNSAGVAYTCNMTNLSLNFTRGVGQVPNTNGNSPVDFPMGVISLDGSISFRYDGSGAGTLHRDFELHNSLGDATHIHQAVWTDADGHTLTIKFEPIFLSNLRLGDGDQYVTGDVDFHVVNDLSLINTATPAVTTVKSIVVTNAISGLMP